VIVAHFNGQSNRQIASAEGIDRDTVGRILSQEEVARLKAEYQSRLFGMVGKAISVYEQALNSDDPRLAAVIATKLIDHVFPKGTMEPPSLEPDRTQQRWIILGQLTEMMLEKKQRYGLPLPPEYDGLEQEASRRLEAAAQR